LWNKHQDRHIELPNFRAAYDLVYASSFPVIIRNVNSGGSGGGSDSSVTVTTIETQNQSSQTHQGKGIKRKRVEDNGSSSSSSSSSSAAASAASTGISIAIPPLGSKALPFSCQVPGCDQAGVNFPGVTEADRRAAGEAHIKSKHQMYLDAFKKDGGHVCDTCGKGYEGSTARDHLSNHKRLHDSSDWGVCEFCPFSAAIHRNVTYHSLRCLKNPKSTTCKHCKKYIGIFSRMTYHLGSHHGIGKFYKCLFCDYEKHCKHGLVYHIYNHHKDKPTITSKEAIREIVFAESFPFVMRNGKLKDGVDGQ
jgi:hypothetical protein